MINILALVGLLLSSPLYADNTPTQTALSQSLPIDSGAIDFDKLKIGMPRAEAQQLLGEPTSITENESLVKATWVFGSGAKPPAPPAPADTDPGLIAQIGRIASTVAGIFNPLAGTATSIGTQVYQASNSVNQSPAPAPSDLSDTRIITLEFKEGKISSIQRSRPTGLASPPP